jgi:hypothetical protein
MCWASNHQNNIEMAQGLISLSTSTNLIPKGLLQSIDLRARSGVCERERKSALSQVRWSISVGSDQVKSGERYEGEFIVSSKRVVGLNFSAHGQLNHTNPQLKWFWPSSKWVVWLWSNGPALVEPPLRPVQLPSGQTDSQFVNQTSRQEVRLISWP